jgi:hypothetical protein
LICDALGIVSFYTKSTEIAAAIGRYYVAADAGQAMMYHAPYCCIQHHDCRNITGIIDRDHRINKKFRATEA